MKKKLLFGMAALFWAICGVWADFSDQWNTHFYSMVAHSSESYYRYSPWYSHDSTQVYTIVGGLGIYPGKSDDIGSWSSTYYYWKRWEELNPNF